MTVKPRYKYRPVKSDKLALSLAEPANAELFHDHLAFLKLTYPFKFIGMFTVANR